MSKLVADHEFLELKNRFEFHPATTEEKRNDHGSVREACLDLACFIWSKVPPGRERSLAITHLEETMMWANAGIARNNGGNEEAVRRD